VFDFIEGWYNPHRRHSSLGYKCPLPFERDHAHAARSVSAEVISGQSVAVDRDGCGRWSEGQRRSLPTLVADISRSPVSSSRRTSAHWYPVSDSFMTTSRPSASTAWT
jgi:hypothetical protein